MRYSHAVGDEAGETGFKFGKGSSTHFVAGLMLFNAPDALRQFVTDFRQRFHLTEAPDFGFHSSPDRNRFAFLRELTSFDFGFRAIVIDKRALLPDPLPEKLDLYLMLYAALFQWVLTSELSAAHVILDAFGNPQQTITALTRRIRHEHPGIVSDHLRSLRTARSHKEPLLQVADIVSGAVFRLVEEGDSRFYRVIRSRTLIWRWGENENPPR